MPLIIEEKNLKTWIDGDMSAYPVSKILSAKNVNSDIPEITKPLEIYQPKLF
ncbi:hypothetical protein [Pedobacter immunditicola]|uniref:hypothetical protein n=1 Tax=Pedobacter immunditicola TaxID=3133440 RepID=UPI00309815A5